MKSIESTRVSFRFRSLCCLVILAWNAPAQQPEPSPVKLNVDVIQGDGAVIRVGQRVTPEPRIRVEDENQRPLAGAAVVFTLPTEGATGEFANKLKTLITTTGKNGEAIAQGLKMNDVPGKTSIHVTASYKGLSALAIISQETVLPPGVTVAPHKHGHGALIAVLAIVGGLAAGGAVYATQRAGGNSSSSLSAVGPAPIGITPGAGTIVGGH